MITVHLCFPSSIYHIRDLKCCTSINTLRPRLNGRHFADDTFKRIFLNENDRILIEISLKFFPKGPINNNPALVQIMAWRWLGDKPLSEPMMVRVPTHICVTRPQWVKSSHETGLVTPTPRELNPAWDTWLIEESVSSTWWWWMIMIHHSQLYPLSQGKSN